jgi:hypothetical protein
LNAGDEIEPTHVASPSIGEGIDGIGTVLSGCLVAVFVLCACFAYVYFNFYAVEAGRPAVRFAGIAGATTVALLEVANLVFGYRVLHQSLPSPQLVAVSLKQWRWPLPLRPLAAAWWLGHQSIVVLGVSMLLRDVRFPEVSTYVDFATGILHVLMYLAGSACGNAYLLLAIAALWPSTRVLKILHRWRVVIVLLICVGLFYLQPVPRIHRLL